MIPERINKLSSTLFACLRFYAHDKEQMEIAKEFIDYLLTQKNVDMSENYLLNLKVAKKEPKGSFGS